MSHTRRIRRVTAGIGLLGFCAVLVPQDLLDPAGNTFYDAAMSSPELLGVSALALLVSALLTVPAICGILHQARDCGATLAHLGALFTLLGAMGHMGLASIGLITRSLAGGDPAQMRAFEERLNADPALAIPFVLLTSFGIGITLLAFAAWRAGLIGWWGPAIVTAVVVAHTVLPDGQPPVITLTALTLIAIVFGRLGIRTLALSDNDWAQPKPSDRSPVTTSP
jgi:hypothetical protein